VDIESLIIEQALKKGKLTTAKIMRKTGFSHAYVHRIFQMLVDGGHLLKTGSTKNARYFPATEANIKKAKSNAGYYNRIIKHIDPLDENKIAADLKDKFSNTDILSNVTQLFDYAFTKILNNAVIYSRSDKLNISAGIEHNVISFEVRDYGTGIFNNIKYKLGLTSVDEAAAELMKGTAGKGLISASKAADTLVIQSSNKKVIFNNLLNDVFIRTVKELKGTKITFNINADSSRALTDILNKRNGTNEHADSTRILVRLFTGDNKSPSRAEANRMLEGLDRFKKIILDFRDVESIGLGFADEVFELWKTAHPETELNVENANDDVMFVIKL
jgi:hypothetical protein